MDERISIFIEKDKVWVGKNTWATSYLNDWLAKFSSGKFVEKKLIDKTEQLSPIRSFIGCTELLEEIGHSITTNWQLKDNQKWLFSIWGQGGEGKSYIIKQIHQTYSWRMLYAKLDHQNVEQTERGLIDIINKIANLLRDNGCPTPNLDSKYKQVLKTKNSVDLGTLVGEVSTKIANNMHRFSRELESFGKNPLKLTPIELLSNALLC